MRRSSFAFRQERTLLRQHVERSSHQLADHTTADSQDVTSLLVPPAHVLLGVRFDTIRENLYNTIR